MTKPDSMFATQVQIAIIGLTIVLGLFYIWKSLNRIELKVDAVHTMLVQKQTQAQAHAQDPMCIYSSPDEITLNDEVAESLMKSVFGDVMMMSQPKQTEPRGSVEVTEVYEEPPASSQETNEHITYDDDDDDVSEALSGVGLSKSKLKAMSVNMLKELCSQRGISADGSKQVLIERLLEKV